MIGARIRCLAILNISCFYCQPLGVLKTPCQLIISRFSSSSSVMKAQNVENVSMALLDWDRGGRKEKQSLTPLYSSMKRIIDQNAGTVCLIQVGSFYELYFDQAEIYAPKLGIKVTKRKTSSYSIPMAGFPVSQLQKFVKILIQELQVGVAIVDQYPSMTDSTQTMLHRKVSRIITPGTLVDETFLNHSKSNFLLAISLPPNSVKVTADPDLIVGFSWIDLSVGDFYVQEIRLEEAASEVSRINPSEIILSKELQGYSVTDGGWYPPLRELKKYFTRYHKISHNSLKEKFKTGPQKTRKLLESYTIREVSAMNMILSHIKVNFPDCNPTLDVPTQLWNKHCLQMDARTRDALELTERAAPGGSSTVGSLLYTMRRTVTTPGARLLTHWIKSPLTNIKELKRRQKFVSLFKENMLLTGSLRHHLSQIGDFVRSLQRLSFGTGDSTYHIMSIREDMTKVQQLKSFLKNEIETSEFADRDFRTLIYDIKIPLDFLKATDKIIDQDYNFKPRGNSVEVPLSSDEYTADSGSFLNSEIEKYRISKVEQPEDLIFVVKRDYSSDLMLLHDCLDKLIEQERKLFLKYRDMLENIDDKITLMKKKQFGRHTNVLHISGKQKSIHEASVMFSEKIKEKRKGSILVGPEEWGSLQHLIQEKTDAIKTLESAIINGLCAKVLDNSSLIRSLSNAINFLDVTSSFAVLANEANLVCPILTKVPKIKIRKGRHLIVESGLKSNGSMFTPNDTSLDKSNNLCVIGGPNMGGKSTFLRQNALIVIMAQIGSFVPAESAQIGIVDRIFTRIGASDDLFSDLSTFMVEMVETSNILKHATQSSLAIVDEVGRGTSGKEGLAIAYATLLSLFKFNRCLTLFATHYGKELQELLIADKIDQEGIEFLRTRVLKRGTSSDEFRLLFDHFLEKGISERSYALEVANMAGFPSSSLSIAERAIHMINKVY